MQNVAMENAAIEEAAVTQFQAPVTQPTISAKKGHQGLGGLNLGY